MSAEKIIMFLIWTIGISAFIIIIPRNRYRRFLFAQFSCQTLTWLSSLIQVDVGLFIFPVREFPKATDLLLTTDYILYPLLCGFYVIYEPVNRGLYVRAIYLSGWVSALVIIDVILEKYTDLIEYVHYTWYFTWINFFILFAITNMVYRWFFKNKDLFVEDREAAQ